MKQHDMEFLFSSTYSQPPFRNTMIDFFVGKWYGPTFAQWGKDPLEKHQMLWARWSLTATTIDHAHS